MSAAAFVGALLLLIPSTETKASWSSVHHQVTPYQPGPAEPAMPDYAYPTSYIPPEPPQQAWREPDADDQATAREIAIAEADSAYGDGYAWAADREVDTPDACRRLRGPRAEGCRDYVASLAPAELPSPPSEYN